MPALHKLILGGKIMRATDAFPVHFQIARRRRLLVKMLPSLGLAELYIYDTMMTFANEESLRKRFDDKMVSGELYAVDLGGLTGVCSIQHGLEGYNDGPVSLNNSWLVHLEH